MSFNTKQDHIAVVIKEFTLKRKSEGFTDRYSEPYIVSIAIDEKGAASPSIEFNIMPFPKVRKGDRISFDGQGHLIYGPSNPGSFLAYSILFMESDRDLRETGGVVEEIMSSQAVEMGAKSLLLANPSYAAAADILQKLISLVAKRLKANKDDELYRRNGTLLRDVIPPYDILRTYTSENDYIQLQTAIIPLKDSNTLGSQTKRIEL